MKEDKCTDKVIYIDFKKKCKKEPNMVVTVLKVLLTNIRLLITGKIKFKDNNANYTNDFLDREILEDLDYEDFNDNSNYDED